VPAAANSASEQQRLLLHASARGSNKPMMPGIAHDDRGEIRYAADLARHLWFASVAGALKSDRMVIEVPDGGMTLQGPPLSLSTFEHSSFEATITAEVAGADYYEHWVRHCIPGNAEGQAGSLSRTDQYAYSEASKSAKYGIATPNGSWSEHCLAFRSGVDLPNTAMERGGINIAGIENMLSKARLTAAPVEARSPRDPRLILEMPDGFVASGLPTFTFYYNHNRLPFGLRITLGDPKIYEIAKRLNVISAKNWKVGRLDRTDEYFYYFVWPDPRPDFEFGFLAPGSAAQVRVNVTKAALDGGAIGVADIERMLASARMVPGSEPAGK
jgi:hypothetical protein